MHVFNVTIVPIDHGTFEPGRAHLQYEYEREDEGVEEEDIEELLDGELNLDDLDQMVGDEEGEEVGYGDDSGTLGGDSKGGDYGEESLMKMVYGRSSSLGKVVIIPERDHIRKTDYFAVLTLLTFEIWGEKY